MIRINTNYVLITILILVLGLFWNIKVGSPEISPPAPPQAEIGGEEEGVASTTIVAVGDILLSRHVGAQIDKTGNPNLPFEKLQPILSQADITFGNLECPLSDSNIPIREGLVFRCLTKYVPGLLFAGFDALSTANNHAMDQGIRGLEFTIDYLKSQNILSVGTSKTTPSLSPPVLQRKIGGDEVGVGFLAYSYSSFNDGKSTSHPQVATLPPLSPPFQGGGEEGVLKSAILNLKSSGAAIVIVSMHAGLEYTRKPTQAQIDFAHAAIDAGADVVLGHHPHWIQEIEIYPPISPPAPLRLGRTEIGGEEEGVHRGIIFYSLGNFVFDQMWSQETREGLMVKLNFENSATGGQATLKSAELMPVIIENFCCPRLADEEEKKTILKKINLDSDNIEF